LSVGPTRIFVPVLAGCASSGDSSSLRTALAFQSIDGDGLYPGGEDFAVRSLSGWGCFPRVDGIERLSEDLEAITASASLTRGLGRSYGDSSLPAASGGEIAGSRLADRILAFDPATGILRAEAGLSLRALNAVFLARGFASPVVPGTQFVTLGGMVASDVHGKNHHVAGCIGEHVRALRMRVADGRILDVSDETERELFRATLGGMGLTGHILEVELRLEKIPSPWLWRETEPAPNLDVLVDGLREASRSWPFTASWADCAKAGPNLGRGFVTRARWATPEEARREAPVLRERFAVPFTMPDALICRPTVRAFNSLWHRLHLRPTRGIAHPQPFFHTLDGIAAWNRLYGPSGFSQYQCVLPLDDDGRAYRRLFDVFVRHCGASPVTVIKDCGAEGRGLLSFPKPGISIAFDVPQRGARTQALVDRMNEVVIQAGGRIYLTKDALTRREHFLAMEPRFAAWNEIRRKWDPHGTLRSAQSVRLFGDAP
jgi:FAD/FMN-containing dehydrogenase